MLVKGIVEKVIDNYTIKVRVPIFDNIASETDATSTDDLGTACVCSLPNVNPQLRVGDIVIVGFENNKFESPIILGMLFTPSSSTYTDISAQNINILSYAHLPTQTIIGDVGYQELEKLTGIQDNIQQQLNDINVRLQIIEQHINSGILHSDEELNLRLTTKTNH